MDPIARAFPEVQRKLLAARIALLSLSVAVMISYGPRYGMIFIVGVHVIVGAVERMYVMRLAAARLKFRMSDWQLWRTLPMAALSAMLAAVAGRWVHHILAAWPETVRLLSCGVAFTLVYGAALWATKSVSLDDFSAILRFLRPTFPAVELAEATEVEEVVL